MGVLLPATRGLMSALPEYDQYGRFARVPRRGRSGMMPNVERIGGNDLGEAIHRMWPERWRVRRRKRKSGPPETESSGYCFRIKIRLARSVRISAESTEIVLLEGVQKVRLVGRAESFSENQEVSLVGSGYADDATALAEGKRWMAAVQAGFAEEGIAADFGDRTPSGHISEYAQSRVLEQLRVDLRAEPHQLVVYPCSARPIFLSGHGAARTTRQSHAVREAIRRAETQGAELDEKLKLAYHLYSAASFEANPDSRLIILMMACETLIERKRRDRSAISHLDRLASDTSTAAALSS